jgi:multisubunit Na+/H+ antiporter MnhF subunit
MTPYQVVAKPDHIPFFVTEPGQTDVLFVVVALILIGAVLAAGVLFFWLHSLPERMVHNRAQFDVVAVLALLSLFTHIHAFWVAALLLALIKFPSFSVSDFSGPLDRIANSLEVATDNRASEDARSEQGAPAKLPPASAPPHGAEPKARKPPKVKHA